MVLEVAMLDGTRSRFLLAIVPGDCKINVKSAARAIGGKKSSCAALEIAQSLALRVDARRRDVGMLWFNAGALEKSIVLNADDYRRIVGDACYADIATPMMVSG